jgi:TonB family protein
VTIKVRASVDPAGRVTNAKLESAGSRYLANLTLQAVEKWEFEPVKIEGQAAASEWLLRFELTNQGTDVYPSRVAP